MPYNDTEVSEQSGSPVEVYDFLLGSTHYRHTSGEETVTLDGDVYEPIPLSRSEISVGGENRTAAISVRVPANHPLAQQYVNSVPGDRATLTIRRFHRIDSTDFIDLFKGRVQSVSFSENGGTAIFSVNPVTSAQSRSIPLFVYSNMCNHVLGQATDLGGCPVDLDNDLSPITNGTYPGGIPFKKLEEVTAISGTTLTITDLDDFPDDWFTGGFVKTASNDYRLVLSHVGTQVTLLLPFSEDVLNDDVTVYAGCDHVLPTCRDKFDVLEDYGGYPYVPTRNPFQLGLS